MLDKITLGYKAAGTLNKLLKICEREFGVAGKILFYAVSFIVIIAALKTGSVVTNVVWQALSILSPIVFFAALGFLWYLSEERKRSEKKDEKPNEGTGNASAENASGSTHP